MLQRTPGLSGSDVDALFPARSRGREGVRACVVGNEPPLDSHGVTRINQDRRRISPRWLVGTILTAISGATLIGGSIIIALQGDITFVVSPHKNDDSQTAGTIAQPVRGRSTKADRLVRQEPVTSMARQEYKAPMTINTGNREVITSREFVRIVTPLSLTSGTYARNIPPFNPLQLFDEGEEREQQAHDLVPDLANADVSVVKHDLALLSLPADSLSLSNDEALAQVQEEERVVRTNGTLAGPAQSMLFHSLRQATLQQQASPLAYASAADTPFNNLDVSVVPENVSLLPKLRPLMEQDVSSKRLVLGKQGDNVTALLEEAGATKSEAKEIMDALHMRDRGTLEMGQLLDLLLIHDPDKNGYQIARIVLREENARAAETANNETIMKAIAAINDSGNYVSVPVPEEESRPAQNMARVEGDEEDNDGPGARLYDSLYETAARNDIPREFVQELVRLFSADTDFQRRVSANDSLELLYTDDGPQESDRPELLFASLTVDGERKELYRFQSQRDNRISFFDPDGRSLQKFLIRKPISEGRMTSGFGMRYHPVMNYAKMHTGVDWANRIGTPILAAGDGIVLKSGWDSGYGRRTEIQHANGYVSTYSHQSGFARGIRPGAKVRQGQVIGYLGSSGLSTGPHLHYEVMVNGRFVDPLKIKLPRSNELDGIDLAEFRRQRDQTRELIARSPGASLSASAL